MCKIFPLVEEQNINERKRDQQDIKYKRVIKQLRIEKQDRKRWDKT